MEPSLIRLLCFLTKKFRWDLSYVRLKGKVGYGGPGKVMYTEPHGDDSY